MSIQDFTAFRGRNALDSNGDKIGSIDEIYEDTDTGKPEWLAVKTGLFGSKLTFIPLANASEDADGLRVPFTKDQIKDAPNSDATDGLSQDEEARLYRHYGLPYGESSSDSGLPEGGRATGTTTATTSSDGDPTPSGTPGVVGNDTSGPETDQAMTRSEEEIRVGTQRQETGRVRLRKQVVSERVDTTVPVEREQVRVEREPITDANVDQATSGPELSEEEHEVVLHEERAVVDKEVVPKERVRLDKDVTTEQQRVSEEVRKEQIDVDGADGRR